MKKFLVTVTLLIAFLSLAFGQATDKSDKTRTALLKLTDQITTAKSHKDVAQLERLLTDEFMLTNPAGFVANKSEYLDGVKADRPRLFTVGAGKVPIVLIRNPAEHRMCVLYSFVQFQGFHHRSRLWGRNSEGATPRVTELAKRSQ